MPHNTASNSSLHSLYVSCFSRETRWIMASLLVVYVLLTPLFVFVLIVGYQRWRQQHLSSQHNSSNHVDVFTYNMAVMELFSVSGIFSILFGLIAGNSSVVTAGNGLLCIITTGHMLFHLLTCVERYLAVVYPIFYLQLRGSAGVRMRNLTIGCVWLISLVVMCLTLWLRVPFETTSFVFLSFTSVAFCFSSISVICALFRSGPGEGGRKGVLTDQSKLKAFQTMVIITGSLSLRFISTLITLIVKSISVPNGYIFCVAGWASAWFFVPSSVVLPLLFLQRVGKLKLC